MSVESLFLKFSADKLAEFAERIEVCVAKLDDTQIWARGHENSNAIGNHASSERQRASVDRRRARWKSRRTRPRCRIRRARRHNSRGSDSPPEGDGGTRRSGDPALTIEQLTRTYDIQNYSVSGVEAVYHVVEHFAEHTGQIIFATKMLTGEDLGFYRHLSNPCSAVDSTPSQRERAGHHSMARP